ncbi:MAG: glycosyltransferase family 4 protein [Coriobacteriia bacterium]|nr:glycosyltransferase family 4 protein [Coriobacteriia bacterium]
MDKAASKNQAQQQAGSRPVRLAVYLQCDTDVGGQFQYALSMLRALQLQQGNFQLLVYSSRRVWEEYCNKHDIAYRPFPLRAAASRIGQRIFGRTLSSPKSPHWLGRLLQKHVTRDKVDVVVFPLPSTLTAYLSVPSIMTIHDLLYRYEPQMCDDDDSDAAHYDDLYQNILLNSSTVLTDSALCARQLREAFAVAATADIQVLPYCAPPYVNEYLQEVAADPIAAAAHISEEVRAAAAQPYLYYPAAFRRHKNHRRLLLALKQLKDEGLPLNLILTSPPWPPADQIQAQVAELDLNSTVTLLSYVSNREVCYLFQHAQALVMPTFNGPTNLPPLEAFALGCPVVISNRFQQSEQLTSGVLLFDPRCPEDIARALREITSSESLRTELIAEGYRRDKELNLQAFSTRLAAIVSATITRAQQ